MQQILRYKKLVLVERRLKGKNAILLAFAKAGMNGALSRSGLTQLINTFVYIHVTIM